MNPPRLRTWLVVVAVAAVGLSCSRVSTGPYKGVWFGTSTVWGGVYWASRERRLDAVVFGQLPRGWPYAITFGRDGVRLRWLPSGEDGPA